MNAASLHLDEESKKALSELKLDEICETLEDQNFTKERSLCVSWEINRNGIRHSCLRWGGKVNKDNYQEELESRNHNIKDCDELKIMQMLERKKALEASLEKCRSKPPMDTLGTRICLNYEINEVELQLNNIYSSLLALLKRIHGNSKEPSPAQALLESQSSWESYMSQQCQIQYRLIYPGTAAIGSNLACRLKIMKSRLNELSTIKDNWEIKGY